MTQGKTKCYHRSLKTVVKLQTDHFPWRLDQEIGGFVEYHNNRRYQEASDHATAADVYFERRHDVLPAPEKIKRRTLRQGRIENLRAKAA